MWGQPMRTGPEGSSAASNEGEECEGEGGSESGAVPSSLIDVVVPEGCFPGMEFAVGWPCTQEM